MFIGPFLTLFVGSCVSFPSWASLAHLLSLGYLSPFPILFSHGPLLTLFGLPWPNYFILYTSSLGLMGLPLAPYFLCLHYFGPTVTHSRFSTYCPWVCFFSLFRPIQARLLPQDPLYEPVSRSFLPLGLNGFFLLANFGLPVLLGFFSYWACQNEPQHTSTQNSGSNILNLKNNY